MELEQMDLNLLIVFKHMLAERSVSRVAASLDLSQPAVSNALARLRKLLGDDLFLRTPAGMVPTPYAEQLSESVTYALGMIHAALNQRANFDPKHSDRTFRISMTDIGEIYFLPRLMECLREEAPGVSVSTYRHTAGNLKEDMEAGKIDLAIGLLPGLKAGFFQRRLFTQRYLCMMRKGHRLDKKKISLEEFSAAEHLVVVSAGTGHGQVDEILSRKGVVRNVVLTVPHFVAVGHILQSTNMVATVPERFAERMVEPFGLVAHAHPAALPQVSINVFWHAKYHREPSNQWLRSVIFDRFSI
jgi:DNA-binding transcriptional LysR family regulator